MLAAACLAACAGGHQQPLDAPTSPSTRLGALTPATDWTTYHGAADRSGFRATGTTATAARHAVVAWAARLDGAVYGSPLVVGGTAVVATEHDSLYAFDLATGAPRWHVNVGTPVPLAALPCGDIDPLGITGTPVYDPATHRVFAVAETTGPRHDLVGIDVRTGHVDLTRSVDPPDQPTAPMQQRAALALLDGVVYVAYGGLSGDCGPYHGHVVGVRTDGTGPLLVYRVPTPREGGIWGTSGPAVTPAGTLMVAIGNGESTTGYDTTDSVVELTPQLARKDLFAPTTWAEDNAHDLDLGSMGPAVLPDGHVVVAGKRGTVYLLRTGSLGGIGPGLATAGGCKGLGGAAVAGPSSAPVVVMPCAAGDAAYRVGPGDTLTRLWAAAPKGSPVVAGEVVWTLDPDAGRLVGLSLGDGRRLVSVAVGPVTRFASPSLSGNLVLVPTLSGLAVVRSG